MRFNQATYPVNEGERFVSITLEALTSHTCSFSVFVSTRDGTASCEWQTAVCFWGAKGAPILFSDLVFLYGFMFVYICHKMAALGFPWIYQAFTRFVFICAAIWLNEKYSRTLLYNTKPSPSLRRTFSRRNSRRRRGPVTKWPPRRLPFTRLEIVFVIISSFTKRTKVVHE